MSAKPNNNRRLVAIIAAAVFAVALLAGLAFAKLATSSDNDREHRPPATATTPAAQPREIVATVDNGMAGNDRQFALLDFQVMPQGGQITGEYTLVTFDGSGQIVGLKHPTPLNGNGGDTTFRLNLRDYGAVKGNLLGDGSPGSTLKFDRTFGVEKYDWTIISSAQEFQNAVNAYAQRFAECSKKHEPEPCENVA